MLRKTIFVGLIFALFLGCKTTETHQPQQEKEANFKKLKAILTSPDKKPLKVSTPRLQGGMESLFRHITYPERARKNHIQGRVIVQFIVTKDGRTKDLKIIKNLGYGCNKVAIRAIKRARFEPAKKNGQPVDYQMSIPITFSLQTKY